MDALALGPLLIPLPRLYAFAVALVLVLASQAALRLPRLQRGRWFNGLLLTWLIAARLGHVSMHWDSYAAAPLDALKFWQPGYSAAWGMLGAAAWSVWFLRHRLVALVTAQVLLATAFAVWLGLMLWNPLGSDSQVQTLPELTLENLDGDPVTLSSLQGETVVLNLWASWCPPCLREMPLLAETDARDGVRVVVVNQGESLLQVVRYLDAHALDFEHALLDPQQRLMALTAAPGLPTTLLFDASGRLVDQHVGEVSRAQLDAWLSR
ncbi:TlpA family protein disulfide reductase [Halomonas sp. McH1-25]|uniref:TlpA disulfide reductase family protein n=1 Tax=unclassified Halomonas TaxID=2609666 RepID=UPI001EF55542|nr:MULTISPECIES: TlpA disulfide reductase family protein [unclassified Halomonas]MCG7601881.1 TlpA family protein disulfide reductase [Halomonas sp. McH1-25]MCP1344148.1 TlpA family protein disulfide reductase [Halomonas sp. FL8]MCP1362696.1 TlpA family protein disulfide reductase [Halomonas sp. BBD45]MCP1364489.1 TlpA family protein disulfide reductase [Halomonas sp. BBD48]